MKLFTDIGKWIADIGKSTWFTDIGKSFTDIGKSLHLPISVIHLPISVNHLPISVIQAYLPISVNAWLALDTRQLDFSWSKNISKAREYSSHSHYGNQSRGYFNYGRPLWPPAQCCAPACSQALPVKPQGVWARGSEAWAGSRDLRNLEFVRWGSSGPSSLMQINMAELRLN